MMSKTELDVLIFALRYAALWHTYAPKLVCEYIKEQLPRMSMDLLDQLLFELDGIYIVNPLAVQSFQELKRMAAVALREDD